MTTKIAGFMENVLHNLMTSLIVKLFLWFLQDGQTPLFAAILSKNNDKNWEDIVSTLLEYGADVDYLDQVYMYISVFIS